MVAWPAMKQVMQAVAIAVATLVTGWAFFCVWDHDRNAVEGFVLHGILWVMFYWAIWWNYKSFTGGWDEDQDQETD